MTPTATTLRSDTPPRDTPPRDAGTHRTSTGGTVPRRGLAPALLGAIRGYQLLRSGRPTGCRYLPTCSEYAVGAILAHGAWRGSLLAVKRVLRCNPWGGHGVDPVPDRRAP